MRVRSHPLHYVFLERLSMTKPSPKTNTKKPRAVSGVRMRFKPTGKIVIFRFWQMVNGVVCYSDGKPVDLSISMFELA